MPSIQPKVRRCVTLIPQLPRMCRAMREIGFAGWKRAYQAGAWLVAISVVLRPVSNHCERVSRKIAVGIAWCQNSIEPAFEQ